MTQKTRKENRTGLAGELVWLLGYVVVGGWLIDQLIKLF